MVNPEADLIDKQVGYMSIVSNVAVERSIKFSNLIVHCLKDNREWNIVDEFIMKTEEIEEMFEQDIRNGLTPTLFILTVGSTQSLSIESIKDVAAAWKKYNVWVHVDAA